MHILNTAMLLVILMPLVIIIMLFWKLDYLAKLMYGYVLLGFNNPEKAHVTTRASSGLKKHSHFSNGIKGMFYYGSSVYPYWRDLLVFEPSVCFISANSFSMSILHARCCNGNLSTLSILNWQQHVNIHGCGQSVIKWHLNRSSERDTTMEPDYRSD